MREIPLTNVEKLAIVDDDMYEYLSKWSWFLSTDGYAVRWNKIGDKYKLIFMHREVANTQKGKITDHINRNKLDNRSENLRVCSHSQNNSNTKIFSTNTSGYRGVSWNKNQEKWLVYVSFEGKNYYVGSFNNKEKAAKAWNKVALELKGEYASLNKIKEN